MLLQCQFTPATRFVHTALWTPSRPPGASTSSSSEDSPSLLARRRPRGRGAVVHAARREELADQLGGARVDHARLLHQRRHLEERGAEGLRLVVRRLAVLPLEIYIFMSSNQLTT